MLYTTLNCISLLFSLIFIRFLLQLGDTSLMTLDTLALDIALGRTKNVIMLESPIMVSVAQTELIVIRSYFLHIVLVCGILKEAI